MQSLKIQPGLSPHSLTPPRFIVILISICLHTIFLDLKPNYSSKMRYFKSQKLQDLMFKLLKSQTEANIAYSGGIARAQRARNPAPRRLNMAGGITWHTPKESTECVHRRAGRVCGHYPGSV